MSNKKKIPFGILIFSIYQFLHSLTLIFGGLNSLLEIAVLPEIAEIEQDVSKEMLMIFQLISIIIGIWGLLLAIGLFKLNDRARRRLVFYTKAILAFSIILFLLGIAPMLLIALISVIVLLYLNSKKVRRAFGATVSQKKR